MKTIHKSKTDNLNVIYYNAIAPNNKQNFNYAEFDQTRDDNFIDNPSEYYMTVARFELPGHYIPIHIMPIQDNQSDVNLSVYSVTLEYNNTIVQTYLEFYPTDQDAVAPDDPSDGQDISEYYFIYTYQHMLDMLNTAFETCLAGLGHPASDIVAPKFTYSGITQLFTLVVQKDYYDKDVALPVNIYMNTKLLFLFQGFFILDYNSQKSVQSQANGKDVQFVISNFDTPDYVGDYYYIEQQFNCVANWNPFKKIVFVGNAMPTNQELMPGSGSASRSILVDFRPDESSQEDVRSVYQYNPSFYRLIDLVSTAPLRRLAFRIYWVDKLDNYYVLKIPYLQQATVKFAFIKKSAISATGHT